MMLRERPDPKADARQRVQLLRVPAGASWHVLATCNKVGGQHTHFLDGRTVGCLRADGRCQACELGNARRFEAYLGCWLVSRRIDAVVALPEGAFGLLHALVGDAIEGDMRGRQFRLERRGDSRRARLHVEEAGPRLVGRVPHLGLDVPAIVARAMGGHVAGVGRADVRGAV